MASPVSCGESAQPVNARVQVERSWPGQPGTGALGGQAAANLASIP
jgi:hypothetical protein